VAGEVHGDEDEIAEVDPQNRYYRCMPCHDFISSPACMYTVGTKAVATTPGKLAAEILLGGYACMVIMVHLCQSLSWGTAASLVCSIQAAMGVVAAWQPQPGSIGTPCVFLLWLKLCPWHIWVHSKQQQNCLQCQHSCKQHTTCKG